MIGNLNKLFIVFFISAFSALYIDYLSKSSIGVYISIIMLLCFFALLIYDFRVAIFSFLFISLITPQFSRSLIYEVVESNNDSVFGFYSFHSTSLFGFSLPILFIVVAGLVSIFKMLKNNIKFFSISLKEPLVWYLLILTLMLLSTFINVLNGRENGVRDIVSDSRLLLIWLSGLFTYKYLLKTYGLNEIIFNLYKVITWAIVIIGLRVVIFAFFDSINGVKTFDFSTQPYVAYPLIFAIIFTFNKSKLKTVFLLVSLLAAFSLKRSDLAFVVLLFFAYFIAGLQSRNRVYQKQSIKSVGYIVSLIIFMFGFLFYFSESAFNFLTYKLNFFTTEIWSGQLSNSALVRSLEFENIFHYSSEKLYPFIFGAGLGGYFNFDYTSMPSFIGVSDYSAPEIYNNHFTKPHTFLNYIFLKGGLSYLLFYLTSIATLFIYSFRSLRFIGLYNLRIPLEFLFIIFFFIGYSIFSLNMFWQPIHSFLFIISLSIIIDFYKELKNEFNYS